MNFTATNNIELREGVVFRTNKDGTIVVMKMNDDDIFFKINGVAAEMWQRFADKKTNLGEVANELSESYSVPSEKIMTDAQTFLGKILELELVRVK